MEARGTTFFSKSSFPLFPFPKKNLCGFSSFADARVKNEKLNLCFSGGKKMEYEKLSLFFSLSLSLTLISSSRVRK